MSPSCLQPRCVRGADIGGVLRFAMVLVAVTSCGCAPVVLLERQQEPSAQISSRRLHRVVASRSASDPGDPTSILQVNDVEFTEVANADAEPSSRTDPAPIEMPTPIRWQSEVISEHRGLDNRYTLAQVVAHARTHHPSIHAASRKIEVARAGVKEATTKPNPNLVLDLDTPLHDSDDATELTTRLTFPFGGSNERHWRKRVVMAQVIKAEADFQVTLRQVADTATAAALRSIFLQQRLLLDRRAEQLAHERLASLAQEVASGDPAKNLLDQLEARLDAEQATRNRFATERELAVTHALVASAMGIHPQQTLSVAGSLDQIPLELPPLQQVIASTEQESEQIVAALAALNESRTFHCLQRSIRPEREFGPRYQDRLGRDDDTLGIRLDLDLDVHRVQSGPIAQSAQATFQQQDEVELARHVWLGEITQIYRELDSLQKELGHAQQDSLLQDQRDMLEDEVTAGMLTASQRLKIEQSILRRELNQLEMQYRIAVLRSQLRLPPGV